MHRFRTLTKLAYSAAQPLQHLFSTFLDKEPPRDLPVPRGEECEPRSVRQLIEVCARWPVAGQTAPSGSMAYVAVAQAFAFFCFCVSIIAMTERKGLFVPNA